MNEFELLPDLPPLPPVPIEKEVPPLLPIVENGGIDEHIELFATKAALKNESVIENLVDKKSEELNAKADAKVLTAQAQAAKADAEKIEAHADKAGAFFDSNKQILGIIGIRHPLGYKTMNALFVPAIILFLLVAVAVFFPFSIVKYIMEFFIDIVGDIAKKIASNGVKVFLAILTSVFAAGLLGAVYWLVSSLIL